MLITFVLFAFSKQNTRLGKTRDCFPALAVRMYNCLPQHLKALKDFECRLRKWSLANPLYSIRDFFENASNIA
ncbi:hypothetical protein J6590_091724 [Homalodisca vitripennis]|nr:hypothetical protein J6590_091724 [Homalodisca vitripennis]